MRLFTFIFLTILFFGNRDSFAQSEVKSHLKSYKNQNNQSIIIDDLEPVKPFQTEVPINSQYPLSSSIKKLISLSAFENSNLKVSSLSIVKDPVNNLPIFIKGSLKALQEEDVEEKGYIILESLEDNLKIDKPREEFEIKKVQSDELGQTHIRLQQMYKGIPIYGSEIIIHINQENSFLINGRFSPTPQLENLTPSISEKHGNQIARQNVENETHFRELKDFEKQLVSGNQVESKLVIFYPELYSQTPVLAWHVLVIPNVAHKWSYFVDANSGDILRSNSELCKVHCNHAPPPTTADAADLFGITRTIDVFLEVGTYFMIDASRSMFNPTQSNIPNEPVGAIWTIDAQNTSPINDDFGAQQVFSFNNNWNNPNAVSAHYNAGKAFEYFKNTFNRNSINGQGGTIISIINVADEDGGDMDNAFWNGAAMFYGNGDQAFTSPLAKSLDVGGHEMGHGVIQATANLEYFGESGAMNESFADIFGTMIDRDDWQLGEDIANPAVFPTGALRDMEDPHNGGNSLSDPGWQPSHMSEKYTGSQDNGGVHINSGIPNKAYYLFAETIGKDKAEKIFYRALDNYLLRSSQFIDLRLSVIQAATDFHGANSTEVNAAKSAFDDVGIFDGSGTDTQVDVDANEGEDFILFTDANHNNLYIFTPEGDEVADPITFNDPLSKPSVTDDGSAIVFIAQDQTMQAITIDWVNGSFQQNQIHPDPIWRNVAIAKDGSRIAALSDDLEPVIWVFDFGKNEWQTFDLYNPTTANGGATTGDVQYPDVLEFDFTGEFVMYDALNEINNTNGADIEYWDIGFVNVWNNASNNWGDNFISKLFSGLPENSSVGNPTFSKNSDFIIAFDFIDEFFNNYLLMAANIQTGNVDTIFQNVRLSYPSYSVADDQMVFDAEDLLGNEVLGFIPLGADKISSIGNPILYMEDANWGVWFANGIRDLTSTEDLVFEQGKIKVYPNPFDNQLNFELGDEISTSFTVNIYDALGKMVMVQKFNSKNEYALNLEGLQSGLYSLRIQKGNTNYVAKVVKR